MSNSEKELIGFFENLFNPAVEKLPERLPSKNAGFVELREKQFAKSYVVVDDKRIRAFEIDGRFEQSKLFNPSRVFGFCCQHDYLLFRVADGTLEVFFVEMKAETDKFEHIRHQLQNGIALLAYIQRLSIDRIGIKWMQGRIRFYATVLFHTGKLPDATKMEKLDQAVSKREAERARYEGVKGVYCVKDNRVVMSELIMHSAIVSYCTCIPNTFSDFPAEVA